jgi:hypothetical protein
MHLLLAIAKLWKSVGKIEIPKEQKSKGRGSMNPINGLQRLERALHQTNNRIKMYRGRGVDTLRISKRDG